MSENKGSVVPFGKYKGQPVEVLAQDRDYCDWLAGQDWFRSRYQNLYQTVIINNFQAPEETPEHNSMQVKFLDDELCKRLAYGGILTEEEFLKIKEKVINGVATFDSEHSCYDSTFHAENVRDKWARSGILHWIQYHRNELKSARERHDTDPKYTWFEHDEFRHLRGLKENRDHLVQLRRGRINLRSGIEFLRKSTVILMISDRQMEDISDVSFTLRVCIEPSHISIDRLIDTTRPNHNHTNGSYREESFDVGFYPKRYRFYVELKPCIGDDYPAILRQMKDQVQRAKGSIENRHVLCFDRFTATGATLDQVRTIFNQDKIRVVQLSDIE